MIPKICWDPTRVQESVPSLEARMVDRQRARWKLNDDWAANQAKRLISRCYVEKRTITWRDIAVLLREAAKRPKEPVRTPRMEVFGSEGLGPCPHKKTP